MSRISQFGLGAKKLLQGFGFLFKHPKLLVWALLPWGIGFLVFAVSWGLFVGSFSEVYGSLLGWFGLDILVKGEGFWEQAAFGGLWLIKQLLKPFLFLMGVLLLSILSYLVYLIAAEPFLDLLAEKVTALVTQKEPGTFGAPPPKRAWHLLFLKSIGQSVVAAFQKVGLFLAAPIIFWVLHFIPVFGLFLYVVLTFLFEMWVLGFTTIEYPMSQELWTFRRRLQFGRQFKYALAGLGLPFLIPFAPLLLQAPMVVGGTLLYHELFSTSSTPDAKSA